MGQNKIRISLPLYFVTILVTVGLTALFCQGNVQHPPELEEGYFTQLNEGYLYEARIAPETMEITLVRDETGSTDTLVRSGRLEQLDESRYLLTGIQGVPAQVLTLADDGTFCLYDEDNQMCVLFYPYSAAKIG